MRKMKTEIRLDKNENPYSPSKTVLKAIENFNMESLRLFPDEDSKNLCDTFASSMLLESENVLATNGIYEAFSSILHAFSNHYTNLIIASPVRKVYENLASRFRLSVQKNKNNYDYTTDLQALEYNDENSIFVLTNPNSETGMFTDIKKIEKFLETFNGLCVIDESYVSFAGESAINLLKNYNKLIIIRALSYSHSLCGAKVDFIISNKENIKKIYKVKNKYNIDSLTENMAIAAIKDSETMFENTLNVILERKRLEIEFSKIGFITMPSRTNFILMKSVIIPSDYIYEKLKDENIFVKLYDKKNELDGFIRMTVSDTKTNNIVLNKTKNIINNYSK